MAESSSPAGSDSSTDCACNAGFTGPNGGTCTVPLDTEHFVTLMVTMPYTEAEFDKTKRDLYKIAVAAAAGTIAANVVIVEIRTGSVIVETKVTCSCYCFKEAS